MQFNLDPSEILQRARSVRLLLLDVDGIMTDGSLYYADSGEELKAFSTLDGQGIKLLQSCGIEVGIISGRKSALLSRRAKELGITLLCQGREDKLTALNELCSEYDYSVSEIAYAGDDLPDLQVLRRVSLGFTVPEAHETVREHAHAQTTLSGGKGAVREIADFLLRAQDKYDSAIARFL